MRFCRPKVREVERVRLEPSDVVVLKLDENATRQFVDDVTLQIKRIFPDNRVAVLIGEVKLTVWGKAKVDGFYD